MQAALLIENNETRLLNAFLDKNVIVLDELIHEKAVFQLPNGQQLNKAMVIANYQNGSSSLQSIVPSEQQIQFIENTAVVSVILTAKGNYQEQSFDTRFRYLRVWQLAGEFWKVIAVSGISLP